MDIADGPFEGVPPEERRPRRPSVELADDLASDLRRVERAAPRGGPQELGRAPIGHRRGPEIAGRVDDPGADRSVCGVGPAHHLEDRPVARRLTAVHGGDPGADVDGGGLQRGAQHTDADPTEQPDVRRQVGDAVQRPVDAQRLVGGEREVLRNEGVAHPHLLRSSAPHGDGIRPDGPDLDALGRHQEQALVRNLPRLSGPTVGIDDEPGQRGPSGRLHAGDDRPFAREAVAARGLDRPASRGRRQPEVTVGLGEERLAGRRLQPRGRHAGRHRVPHDPADRGVLRRHLGRHRRRDVGRHLQPADLLRCIQAEQAGGAGGLQHVGVQVRLGLARGPTGCDHRPQLACRPHDGMVHIHVYLPGPSSRLPIRLLER